MLFLTSETATSCQNVRDISVFAIKNRLTLLSNQIHARHLNVPVPMFKGLVVIALLAITFSTARSEDPGP